MARGWLKPNFRFGQRHWTLLSVNELHCLTEAVSKLEQAPPQLTISILRPTRTVKSAAYLSSQDIKLLHEVARPCFDTASHEGGVVKRFDQGIIGSPVVERTRGSEPHPRRGPSLGTVHLTCGRHSERLHHHPACGGPGSGRRDPSRTAAGKARAVFGSPTRIRQD